MAQRDIYMTEEDHDQLSRLIAGARQRRLRDLAHVERLDEELDRAHVVPAGDIPPDVVTMNSRMALRDLDTNEDLELTLVFPHEANWEERRVSVLAPLGTAVLGFRAGDVIEWEVPGRTRRLRVERILFQPESALHKPV